MSSPSVSIVMTNFGVAILSPSAPRRARPRWRRSRGSRRGSPRPAGSRGRRSGWAGSGSKVPQKEHLPAGLRKRAVFCLVALVHGQDRVGPSHQRRRERPRTMCDKIDAELPADQQSLGRRRPVLDGIAAGRARLDRPEAARCEAGVGVSLRERAPAMLPRHTKRSRGFVATRRRSLPFGSAAMLYEGRETRRGRGERGLSPAVPVFARERRDRARAPRAQDRIVERDRVHLLAAGDGVLRPGGDSDASRASAERPVEPRRRSPNQTRSLRRLRP